MTKEDEDIFAAAVEASLNAPRDPNNRECDEYLTCPACGGIDLDFELVDFRLVRSYCCGVLVKVTGYDVSLGPPEDPTDHVGYRGVVVTSG